MSILVDLLLVAGLMLCLLVAAVACFIWWAKAEDAQARYSQSLTREQWEARRRASQRAADQRHR